MIDQGINKGTPRASSAGVHDKIRWFVNHHKDVILKDNTERNIFRNQIYGSRGRRKDGQAVLLTNPVARFVLPATYKNVSIPNPLLNS
jgi:hypothetical protein